MKAARPKNKSGSTDRRWEARRIRDLEADLAAERTAAKKRMAQVEAYASAVSDLASGAERLIEAGLVEGAQMLLKMNRMIQIEYLRGRVSQEPGGVYYEGNLNSADS